MRRQGKKGSIVVVELARWTFDDEKATEAYADDIIKAIELNYNLAIFNLLQNDEEFSDG